MSTSLKAIFGMDSTGFRSELKQTMAETRDAVNKWGNVVMAVGVAAVIGLSKSALDLAGRLTDVSQNLGINIEALQALENLHARNGVAAEQFAAGLTKVKNNIYEAAHGGKAQKEALDALGISAVKLLKLAPERQYEAIAKAVLRSKDQTAAFNAASAIFGEKVGPKLMASLRELAGEGFDHLLKSEQEAGRVMGTETAAGLDRAGDAIEDFRKRAIIAIGNIIVNFRSEEGLAVLWAQFERIVVSFGLGVLDAISEANSMVGAVLGGGFMGVVNKFRDAMLSTLVFAAEQISRILPKRFQIDVANIEAMKSAGLSVGDSIVQAIAKTSPSTLKKDYQEVQDKHIENLKKGATEAATKLEGGLKKGGEGAAKPIKTAADPALVDAGKKAAEPIKAAAAEVAAAAQALAGGIGRKGKDPEELTVEQLKALEAKIKASLFNQRQGDQSVLGPEFGPQGYKSPQQYLLEQELARVKRELALRGNYTRDSSFFGQSYIDQNYAPTDVERLRNLAGLTSAAEQTNQKLDKLTDVISARLPAGGLDALNRHLEKGVRAVIGGTES